MSDAVQTHRAMHGVEADVNFRPIFLVAAWLTGREECIVVVIVGTFVLGHTLSTLERALPLLPH